MSLENANFDKKLYMAETITGIKFITSVRDSYGFDFVNAHVRGQSYSEPFTSRLIYEHSKNNKGIAVFAGAYIGDHAIPSALAGVRCLAFEPDIRSAKLMELNSLLNKVELEIVTKGLASTQGTAYINEADAISSIYTNDSQLRLSGTQIDVVDLDGYISNSQFVSLPVTLIQFDMEGGEVEALKGARQVIDKYSPLLVIEIHSLYDEFREDLASSKTVSYLLELEYEVYALRDYNTHYYIDDRLKYELIPVNQCFVQGPHHGFNLIAFRGNIPDFIRKRSKIVSGLSPKLIPSKFNDPRFRLTEHKEEE
jgi:FkbM family methyltransferase